MSKGNFPVTRFNRASFFVWGLLEFLFRSCRQYSEISTQGNLQAPLFLLQAMALPDQLQAINQITEALGSDERRRLLYLCGALELDDSAASTRETLIRKVLHNESGHLLLMELMVRLRRFDILRQVYKSSREDVERFRAHTELVPKFRVLMADLSEDMGDEDVNSAKFLLGNMLPHEKMDKAKSFLDVVVELEKQGLVSSESVCLVEKCLREISRVDLAKKVNAYKMSAGISEQQTQRAPCMRPPSNSYNQTREGQSFSANIPASVYRGQGAQRQLDAYKFKAKPRGVCVIIDCVGNDGDMLEQTFKALHFSVVLYKWLSVDEILSALTEALKRTENRDGDGFICCIISRGTENHLLGTDLYGVGLKLDRLKRLFTAAACPALVGKPKLFFIQRYSIPESQPFARREHRDEDLETDGCKEKTKYDVIPEDADVFWSHCWTDEHQLEQGQHNSVYLKALKGALHKGQMRKTNILDVHTEVNGAIFENNGRNPEAKYHIDLKHTLRKDLYLQ